MDGQRQRSGGRGRRHKRTKAPAKVEPILIAARRPNAPRLGGTGRGPAVAASARPKSERPRTDADAPPIAVPSQEPAPRRTARIVATAPALDDERERLRSKLLDRLLTSEGHSSITRAALQFREAGFDYPIEQQVQLQLLEHLDEQTVCGAIEALVQLVSREAPQKTPVLEQRLRRLEEYAEEAATRAAAADLRRLIRTRASVTSSARDR